MKTIWKFLKENRKELVIGFILALLAIIFLQKFFIIGTIPSESMDPTLQVSDKVYLKTNYTEVERGRIYSFKKDNTYLIKRCIGVAGDHIVIKGDDVYLNDEKLNERYVSSKIKKDKIIDIDLVVPENKVFFLGDNREVSFDARLWDDKFVDVEDILGEATKIVFPFSRISDL